MLKVSLIVLAAVASASVAQAQTLTPNSAPAVGFHYGAGGNDYSPANTLVLDVGNGAQLYGRWHPNSDLAPASDANGVYSFALGTPSISYDFGFTAPTGTTAALFGASSLLTLTNLGTGATVNYNPVAVFDNYTGSNSIQNSERLTFSFLSGVGFNPNVNDTYSMKLSVNNYSLTTFAKVGTGAVAAVPEVATWVMMMIGIGAIGAMARYRKRQAAAIA